MGEALRNSVKSSALFNEALDTILEKFLRPAGVYDKATWVNWYESMRAGVGLVTRVGSMEGGDDVQAIAAFGKVELWVAWLDPAALLVSHNLDMATDLHQPRINNQIL